MSLLVLMAGRFALSADFWDSAIVYSPEVFGAVVSCSHCLLRGVEAGKRGRVADSEDEVSQERPFPLQNCICMLISSFKSIGEVRQIGRAHV